MSSPAGGSGAKVTAAYGISFVCGADDVNQVLTEVRRRARWAQSLTGSDTAAVSAPALVLLGAPCTGQRRLTRLVARALAEAGQGSGQIHSLSAADVAERGPDGLRGLLAGHAGEVVLLEDLDTLLLDSPQGPQLASALYRARTEGATGVTLVTACAPDRFPALSSAFPALASDLRQVRLPDLTLLDNRIAVAEVLLKERALGMAPGAWDAVRRDLRRMRGRSGLTGARLIEAYLEHAATRHFGQAESTLSTEKGGLRLDPSDFDGIAEELEPGLRDVKDLAACRAELAALAGLGHVKEALQRLTAEAQVLTARRQAGLPVSDTGHHLAFAADPGTGKSTVARLLGQLYAAVGLLDTGQLVECTPADLAGPGGAVAAVRARTDAALGGILLVDGAAALGEPQARAVLAELTRAMDDRRDRLVVVCADRPGPLRAMIAAQPALGRRLSLVLDFPTPSDADLAEIFLGLARAQQYVPDDALRAALPARIGTLRAQPGFAAATTVRGLFDDTVARQSLRIVSGDRSLSAPQLTRLTVADLPSWPGPAERPPDGRF
jgi:hypothetical protein